MRPKRLLISLMVLSLSPVLALAAPPPLTLPAKITGQPGSFIRVKADTPGKTVRWLALDAGLNLFPVDLLKDTHTAVAVSPTPGTYRLMAVTALADEVSDPAVCQIVIEGPTPAPTPSPGPPTPAPDQVGKAAWAIVVLDNNARTPAQAQLLGAQTLVQGLQARGVTLRVLDVTDPAVKANNYQSSVDTAGGPPVLLVFDDKGKKIKFARLPGDEASFLAEFPAPARAAPSCGPNGCPFTPYGSFLYPEIAR